MICFVTIQRMLEMINGTRMTRIQLIYKDFLNYIHALISEYPFNPCHPCSISFFAE